MKLLQILCFSLILLSCNTPNRNCGYHAIHSGIAWFDQHKNEVNAHGACIVKEGERYYLFGEYKSDTTNAFVGFSCYSSIDLMNWNFERLVLPVQEEGILGPNRVGERVKVMKCPSTDEFVMYMHTDDLGYMDPRVGYAVCKTINGEYEFRGELLHDGNYIRKWDLGTFQDTDNKGYLLTHEGNIYELNDDYKSVNKIVSSNEAPGGESPAMFKKEGVYFWLFSNKTSWERNDNYYLSATSLEGPWNKLGHFAPEGTLTWNSQCSFVFPIVNQKDTLHLYMGDRWSYPKQGSAGTYVWLPIEVKGKEMSLPYFYDSWIVDFSKKENWRALNLKSESLINQSSQKGLWIKEDDILQSNEKGSLITCTFEGQQIAIKALVNNKSGYAKVQIKDENNTNVLNTIVDFYSNVKSISQNFISPVMEFGKYTLTIEVMGEHPKWSDKRKSDYGSTDNYIQVIDIISYKE